MCSFEVMIMIRERLSSSGGSTLLKLAMNSQERDGTMLTAHTQRQRVYQIFGVHV